jgi:hypothetical protein
MPDRFILDDERIVEHHALTDLLSEVFFIETADCLSGRSRR